VFLLKVLAVGYSTAYSVSAVVAVVVVIQVAQHQHAAHRTVAARQNLRAELLQLAVTTDVLLRVAVACLLGCFDVSPVTAATVGVKLNQTADVKLNQTADVKLNQTVGVKLNQTADVKLNQTVDVMLNQTAELLLPAVTTDAVAVACSLGCLAASPAAAATADVMLNQTAEPRAPATTAVLQLRFSHRLNQLHPPP